MVVTEKEGRFEELKQHKLETKSEKPRRLEETQRERVRSNVERLALKHSRYLRVEFVDDQEVEVERKKRKTASGGVR